MIQPTRQPLLVIPGDSPMYDSLYIFGCTYAQSADLIEAHADKAGAIAFVFPAVVCQSFAIELFLKFFIVFDHPSVCSKGDLKANGISLKKHGHSHSSMWDAISTDYQNLIVSNYKGPKGTRITPVQFRQKLLDIDDHPFVKWRYIHEEPDMSFLRQDQIKYVTDALGFAAQGLMEQRRSQATQPSP